MHLSRVHDAGRQRCLADRLADQVVGQLAGAMGDAQTAVDGQQDHQRPRRHQRSPALGHQLEDRVQIDLDRQCPRDLAGRPERRDRPLELVAAAFETLETAGVVDADGGVLGQDGQHLLVGLVELRAAGLLGQVEVAVDLAADHDRTAEERRHRGVRVREAVGAGIPRHICEPEDPRVRDDLAQHAAAVREVADHEALVRPRRRR